jgi:predicted ester cyclase
MIERYHQSFPDLQMEIDELIVGGDDTVVARLTLRGTDLGGCAGRPPTGHATREWVVNILHFEDDRVVREWIGADKLGLFIDLGAVADPWPA